MNQPAPAVVRELRESESAARQRRDYHHQKFDQAFAKLKSLGARCPGVECREVQEAGLALSATTRGEVHKPFMAFADAIREHARSDAGQAEGEAVKRLANKAMDHMRELAHHVDREARAQRELQLFKHTLESFEPANEEATATRGPRA